MPSESLSVRALSQRRDVRDIPQQPQRSLFGKVVIVTGASRGIGRATAIEFARAGARVIIAARSVRDGAVPGTILETVKEVEDLGGEAIAVRTDVSQESDVERLAQETTNRYGRIDVLVNNAGVGRQSGIALPTTVTAASMAAWDLIMSVNLRGPILCARTVLPVMSQQGGGSIINVSSVFSLTPSGVAKAGLDRFTMALAHEVRDQRIAVNALCPDFTVSEGFQLLPSFNRPRTWQHPEQWARYAVFVARQDVDKLSGRCLNAADLDQLIEASGRST
jgi:3-oxoacyl-[acyl-carrier protein] reductase